MGKFRYDPFWALIEAVEKDCPEVLVLGGPFVSGDHPRIKDGTLLDTFQEHFQANFIEPLEDLLASHPKLQIVLVPALNDAHHDSIYPQPPMQIIYRDERVRTRWAVFFKYFFCLFVSVCSFFNPHFLHVSSLGAG